MNAGKKEWLQRIALTTISTVIAFLMVEIMCRLVLDPIDFLVPEIENDAVLGVKIRPYSAGHDAWGYRNRTVPDSAEIVAIGDSQTYGVSAPARYSWPAWLAGISGKQVYNLSLGGYDPVDYYYLLEKNGLRLGPKQVVVGFYFGNDLSEAYRKVYSREHWAELRDPAFKPEEDVRFKNVETVLDRKKFLGGLRQWLARRSFLYRATTTFLANRINPAKTGGNGSPNGTVVYENLERGISTTFKPLLRLGAVDLEDGRIREGLRISLAAFHRIQDLCRVRGIGLTVLLIPSKEHVYAELIEHREEMPHSGDIARLLQNEREVGRIVRDDFAARGIRYLDVTTPLQKAATAGMAIYPPFDGHPNRHGYEIIARELWKHLAAPGETGNPQPAPSTGEGREPL